jgi:predicted RNA binding protein YcfA (HicA-like mRNA interferase family)
VILSHPESDHNVVVPIHRELRRGTLNGILKDAGITTRELRRLL